MDSSGQSTHHRVCCRLRSSSFRPVGRQPCIHLQVRPHSGDGHGELLSLATCHLHFPARRNFPHPLQHARTLHVRLRVGVDLGNEGIHKIFLHLRNRCSRRFGPRRPPFCSHNHRCVRRDIRTAACL